MKTCVAQPVDVIVADAEKELYAQHKLYRKYGKRAFDLLSSAVGLLLLLPVFLILSIWIFAYDRGPVLYKQARIGRGGKPFGVYKFRTMVVNADQIGPLSTGEHDPRITAPGRFLRKTSLDELPQLLNVLLGDMSIVGPRPHMLKHTAEYSQLINKYMVRHFIKPGITGWAQVTGFRGETKELWQMEGRVQRDIWYIEHWTFLLDLYIMYKTVYNAIHGEKEAY